MLADLALVNQPTKVAKGVDLQVDVPWSCDRTVGLFNRHLNSNRSLAYANGYRCCLYSSTHPRPPTLEGRWVVNATHRRFIPGKSTSTHCTGGLVGFRAGLDVSEKYPLVFEPRTGLPVTIRYTDYAIPAVRHRSNQYVLTYSQ